MEELKIIASNLSKSYNGLDFVFKDISFQINSGEVFGILGPNGSGKSTLLKIVARILIPTEGNLSVFSNGIEIPFEKQRLIQSLVAPYLVLFEEFTPLEHISINANILGKKIDKDKATELINKFGLYNAKNKHIKEFSSGMKQRMKFVLAFLFEPNLLLLDEPFTNLDENGIQCVENFIRMFKLQGKIIVIATNDLREASHCTKTLVLGKSAANEPDLDSSV